MAAPTSDDRRAALELLCSALALDGSVVDECLLAERANEQYCAEFGPALAEVGVVDCSLVRDAWRAFLLALRRRGVLVSLDWSFGVDDVLFNFDRVLPRYIGDRVVEWPWRNDSALSSATTSTLLPRVAATLRSHGFSLVELSTDGDDHACVLLDERGATSVETLAFLASSLGRRARRVLPS